MPWKSTTTAGHPGIVTRGQKRHISRPTFQLSSVVHPHLQYTRNVVLKVWSFAAFSFCQRLDRSRPSPTRLEDGTAHRGATDFDELNPSIWELSNFVWFSEIFQFCLTHDLPPVFQTAVSLPLSTSLLKSLSIFFRITDSH
jgi:hypothetical protein